MKNFLYILLFTTLALQSCKKSTNASQERSVAASTAPISQLFDEYYEERLKLYPFEATSVGDNRYNDLFPNDLAQARKTEVQAFYTKYKDALAKYDRTSLAANEQISYDVLNWECDINLEGLKYPFELMPLNQFSATHLIIGQLASGQSLQPFKTVKDYEDWLSRLDKFTVWCDTAIVNMKKGIQQGLVIPKVLTEKMLPQFASFNHGPVKDHLFYSPIKNFPKDFTEADKKRLDTAYTAMITNKIIPTFQRLYDFTKKEYLPACRATSGIGALPDGANLYQYLIKVNTTTSMTADEIFALGESEVARITQEMEKVKTQVGFKGDLKAFFDYTRKRKELMPFTKPEQVIAHFEAIHDKMKPNLEKLFSKTPKTPFEIRRTEAFREVSASAEYFQGSQDGTRPGVFYVPIPNVKTYNTLSDEDLFLHEAIPGHHYQISLQQENTDLPKFRRILGYNAFAEGWALYTESLGKELGLYDDPYQYFGMLSAEMHRAIRLVVDAGIHSKGWTREKAIQYSLDHEAETEDAIISEIERYMAIPGQALGYKVGQLKIRELRAKAEKELGNKFDIKEFHNQVLDSGCLPLRVLEQKIDAWIKFKG